MDPYFFHFQLFEDELHDINVLLPPPRNRTYRERFLFEMLNEEQFREQFRMSKASFNILLAVSEFGLNLILIPVFVFLAEFRMYCMQHSVLIGRSGSFEIC